MLNVDVLRDKTQQFFEREARALGILSGHPHIVAVYEIGATDAGQPYIVMEYVERGSCADQPLPLRWADAVELTVKVASGLEASHRLGLLHRDVKPENVLLSAFGEPKLADFGIARLADRTATTNAFSPMHAAPEVLAGMAASVRSDIYALASSLYTLLAGHAPFERLGEDSIYPLLARVQTQPPPSLLGTVPEPVCRAVEKGLAKEPVDRPSSAEAFARLLQDAQRELGIPVTTFPLALGTASATQLAGTLLDDRAEPLARSASGDGPRNRNRLVFSGVATAIVAVAVAAGVGFGLSGGAGKPKPTPTPTGNPGIVIPTDLPASGHGSSNLSPSPSLSGGAVRTSTAALTPLLLEFTDLGSGGNDLPTPPAGGIATVGICGTPADESGKLAEANRALAAPEDTYTLNEYLASFSAGQAHQFMTSLRSTAQSCAVTSPVVDNPVTITPPPQGDEALRLTYTSFVAIWVRHGDYVVETSLFFSVGRPNNVTTAQQVATQAVAKLAQGLS